MSAVSAPGRLLITAHLDRIQVVLPVERRVEWEQWGSLGVLTLSTPLLGMGVLVLGGLLLLLGAFLEARLRSGEALSVRQSTGLAAILLAGGAAFFAMALQVGELLLLARLLILPVGVLLYGALLGWLARQTPTLLLEQATLTIQRGRQRTCIPLEAVDLDALPLERLRPAERDWLVSLIRDHQARRVAALAGEGHDLVQPATPPEALEALRQGVGTGISGARSG